MSLRQFLRCLPLAAILIVAACSEKLETGTNCPVLCTTNTAVFKDTTFDIVTFDTAYDGFTGDGERWRAPAIPTSNGTSFVYESYVSVINRPDSVDVRQIFRFDTLPNTLSASDTTKTTAVTDSRLLLVVDTARSKIPTGTSTISVYDVDDSTAKYDTLAAPLTSRFVPSRLIAQRSFTKAEIVADTITGSGTTATIRALTVTLSDSVMLAYIKRGRMRIGVQITSAGSTALSLVAPAVNSADLVPRLSYDPSPDTAIKAWVVSTKFVPDSGVSLDRLRSQMLVVKNTTPVVNDGSLVAGGLVASRGLLRVKIPRGFLDTVTVVRATLDLTQRPQRTVPGARDGVRVRLRNAIAGPVLSGDGRRIVEFLDPTIEGVQLASLLLYPADSGARSFDIGAVLKVWQAQDSTLATNLVLYGEGETFQEQRPMFYSRRASNPAVRPRLRVTYTLRREGAIP